MKKVVISIIGFMLLLVPYLAPAFSGGKNGCAGECTDCHKLDRKEVDEIIKKGNASISVTGVTMSPIKGLWMVQIEADGKRGVVLMDFAKKHILQIQGIVAVDSLGQPPPERKVNFSAVPLQDAVVLGERAAKKKVVVFTDPDCPFCRKLHEDLKSVVAKRKDIAFYLMLFPLPMHTDAYPKVQAVLCERSLDLAERAFAGKTVPAPQCGNDRVEKNIALAASLQINSTPTLIRSDGTVLMGMLPTGRLIDWIDDKK